MRASTRRREFVFEAIRQLYREDDEFQLIWDDYRLARKARRYFNTQGNQERTREYILLCNELERSVREYIDSR